MAALVEFVCIASHGDRREPSVTLEQRAWAYCAAGAADGHEWTRIDPTAVETLRSRPSGGVNLAADKRAESRLAARPAR